MKRGSFAGGALANSRVQKILRLVILLALGGTVVAPAQAQGKKVLGEWSSYAGDKASTKYSPLTQINGENFSRLKVAWTWGSPEAEVLRANPQLRSWVWETTPLMAGGVLYVSTSLSQVAAIDPATGKVVGEVVLPRNATAAPMTYMLNGKQYIVVATGGSNLPAELIALCLP